MGNPEPTDLEVSDQGERPTFLAEEGWEQYERNVQLEFVNCALELQAMT
jgi:hypothetical protein